MPDPGTVEGAAQEYLSLLQIQEIKNMGKGLVSLENIASKELVLKIPQELIVTRHCLPLEYSGLTEIQSLVVFLALLRVQTYQCTRDLFFQTYYKNVEAVKLPMFFSQDIQAFFSQSLKKRVQKQLDKYNQDLQEIKLVTPESLDKYLTEAWVLVNTRCVSLVSSHKSHVSVGLIPFLDYLNHSCKSKITPMYNTSDKSFELWNSEEIIKGEQVYLSYGNHDSTFLATEYGFVEEDNEFDYLLIEKDLVYSKCSVEVTAILDILTRSRIQQEFVIHFQYVCYSLLMTLRLAIYLESSVNLVDVDLSVWEELVRGERDVISQENEKRVNCIIHEICLQVKKVIEKRLIGMRSRKHIQEYKEEIELLEKLTLQELKIVNSILLP